VRKFLVQLLTLMGRKLWPPGPLPVEPRVRTTEEDRRHATRLEVEVRAELVRAQNDALRLRVLTDQEGRG
jgi:hypothetical protein